MNTLNDSKISSVSETFTESVGRLVVGNNNLVLEISDLGCPDF